MCRSLQHGQGLVHGVKRGPCAGTASEVREGMSGRNVTSGARKESWFVERIKPRETRQCETLQFNFPSGHFCPIISWDVS